jgi:EmrB/QacA subfamily drug resistance transporter
MNGEAKTQPGLELTRSLRTETGRVRSTPLQRWTLGLAALASFVVVLDLLVVATALTAIRGDLGASVGQLEWTVNAYTLSFAVLLMTAAALGDRFGRRRMFAVGLALFGVASAACALAPDVGWLIAARAVQGAGAATIMPLALALMNGAFPPERRGWATGVYSSVTGLAALLGPVVGGAVTEGISWQWIFWLNVPIALVAIPLVLTRIEEAFGPPTAIDLPGLALVSAAALGVVWALVRAGAVGWGSPQVLVPLLLGVGLAVGFVGVEARAGAPMLPMRLFRARAFFAGNTVIFLLNAALTGAVFFTAQFLQAAQGHSPFAAGLRLLPWGVTPFLLAPRAGALVDRFGGRSLIVTGLALQAVGMGWMAAIASPAVTYLALAAPMTVAGIGFSIALPAVTKTVVGSVAPPDMGKASGTFTMFRQLGGAFGVAVLAVAFTTAGGYGSANGFSDGYTTAMAIAGALSLLGAIVAVTLAPIRTRTPVVTAAATPANAPTNELAAVETATDVG